nr:MAG TPA: hypothetical protein [Caudoviricetes sp.]
MGMGDKNINLSASIKVGRKPKDGTDGVTYEIQLDTDSVVLDSATKQFVTHKLGDVHFIYHQGSYTEDMTSRIINTYSYIILYYGYEGGVYKAISYSSDEGVTDIWNTMQMNLGADSECYAMKYIWYDKNLPDDKAMFKKIWSELDGVPPTELGIKILATKMFTVSRNGDSIKSSDVVFGISGSNTQPPTSWITNFSDLVLEQGKYVWTCTKTILTSSSTPIYTGAYCLGECYDFAQVEELYALSDSSTNPPESGWNASYKVVKGKYLWSCVKVTYNDANISYLNKKCVSYFPNDGVNGTKFTPKGTAYAHYSKASELPTPSIATVNRRYLVDVDDKSTPVKNTPCVCYYKNTTTFMSDVAAEGDAYNIGGTLWVHDGKVWHDFGSVQGPKGDDGEDALNIELSVEKILFSYDKNDFDPKSKIVTLIVRQGGNVIKPSEYNVKIIAAQNFDINPGNNNIAAVKKDTYYTITCYAKGVTFYSYSYDNNETSVSYPASSCSIKIAVGYNGITYFKELSIEVSFVKMYGGLNWDIEHLSSTYGKLTNGFDGTLVQMETRVNQNAKTITLEATKTIGEKLEKSGVYIESGKILAKTNHFEVQNSNGDITFTIDKDGNLVSEGNASFKGCITATSGNIGGLEIYNNSYEFGGQTFNYKGLIYENKEYEEYIPNRSVCLNDRYLYVGYGDSGFGGVFIAGYSQNQTSTVEGQTEFSVGAFLTVESHTDNSATMQSSTAGRFTASSNKDGRARALEVNAYGGMKNYAVDAMNGDIRVQNGAFIGAFCGNVNKGNNSNNVTDNYTLKPTDSIIVCNNTKEIKITFPREGIKAGQMFIVIAGTSSRIKFGGEYGTATSILCQGELYCGTRGQWNFILFDGKTWHIRMVWN